MFLGCRSNQKENFTMKELLKITGIFALLLAVIPALSLFVPQRTFAEDAPADGTVQTETVPTAETESGETTAKKEKEESTADTIKVLDFTSGQVMELSMRDYVLGAVLAEMPATYCSEALKAQAVAARTYALRQREKQRLSPDPELMGADISNDSRKFQAYFTPEQAKDFYGSGYEAYCQKAADAVDDTDRLALFYDDEPIVAAFHSTSGGKTESAEVVWGNPAPYLVPVESPEDTESPTYLEEEVFTEKEFRKKLEKELPDANFSVPAGEWIEIRETSTSGTVTEMLAGGEKLSGTDFRSIFSLRSANFTVVYNADEENFYVTTKGCGHGVGLSQYGANAMGENGSDFREILLHYYTGAEIKEY